MYFEKIKPEAHFLWSCLFSPIQSQKYNTDKVILRKKYLTYLLQYPQKIFKTFQKYWNQAGVFYALSVSKATVFFEKNSQVPTNLVVVRCLFWF